MSKPMVVTYSVASVDGRIAISPDVLLLWGDERWPGGLEASEALEWIKVTHRPQATLEGSGSFVREGDEPAPLPPYEGDPALLYEDYLPETVVGQAGHRGWFLVVDGRGRVRGWTKDGAAFGEEWAGWHLLVLVAHHTPPAYLAMLRREAIPYLVGGEERVDLPMVLDKLGSRLGVRCVLSTAGGRLNGALLRTGVVDEVNVEFLPALIGGRDTPSLFNGPALRAGERPARLELISARAQAGGRVWLRYRVAAAPGSGQ